MSAGEGLRVSQAASLSLAEDAEMTRAKIMRYKDHLEQLADDRTNKMRQAEEPVMLLLDSVGDGIVGIQPRR
jgi:hypothetical protein